MLNFQTILYQLYRIKKTEIERSLSNKIITGAQAFVLAPLTQRYTTTLYTCVDIGLALVCNIIAFKQERPSLYSYSIGISMYQGLKVINRILLPKSVDTNTIPKKFVLSDYTLLMSMIGSVHCGYILACLGAKFFNIPLMYAINNVLIPIDLGTATNSLVTSGVSLLGYGIGYQKDIQAVGSIYNSAQARKYYDVHAPKRSWCTVL